MIVLAPLLLVTTLFCIYSSYERNFKPHLTIKCRGFSYYDYLNEKMLKFERTSNFYIIDFYVSKITIKDSVDKNVFIQLKPLAALSIFEGFNANASDTTESLMVIFDT